MSDYTSGNINFTGLGSGTDFQSLIDGLIKLIATYNPNSNSDLIRAAFEYGGLMHFGQYRHSGDPYFTHPFEVAQILADMQRRLR